MTEVEDLLRRTFADRERDLDGAAPSLAGVRERSRRRRRGHAAVLAGAVAVTAVLAGTTVALTAGPRGPAPVAAPAGEDPTSAPGGLPPFRAAPFTYGEGRTSAVVRWAPTWLPDGIRETGRMVSNSWQIRNYGRNGQAPVVRVMATFEGCPDEIDLDGRSGVPGVAAVAGGTPARVWSFQQAPTLGVRYLPALAGSGHLACVRVASGGFWALVTGTADTAADAVRVTGSVRAADPAEVAVRISVADIPDGAAYADGIAVHGGDGGTGGLTVVLGTGNAVVELGPPDPDGPPPNTTVDGRPAHLTSFGGKGAVLTVPLDADLQAVFTAHWPDTTLAQNRAAVLAAARGLRVGPTPDYSWLSR
jgi:hypothetical protein